MALGRRGGFEGLEVCGEFAWGFQIQATREVMRATYARRKISAKLFFAIVWAGENSRRSFFLPWFRGTLPAWGMLGGRDLRPASVGTFTSGTKPQTTSEPSASGETPKSASNTSPPSALFGRVSAPF